MRRALEWLGGSVLVYALTAACAGGAGSPSSTTRAEAGAEQTPSETMAAGGVPNKPSSSAGADSTDAAGLGGILDPVPPAMAAGGAPSEPGTPALTTVKLPCDAQIKVGASNQPAAIFELSDKGIGELSRAAAVVTFAGSDVLAAEGFTGRTQFTYVRAGAVGVVCGNASESVLLTY